MTTNNSTMNTIPRRSRLDLNTPAELVIHSAIQEIEKMAADTRLTEAVILLLKAKDSVSDYVDDINTLIPKGWTAFFTDEQSYINFLKWEKEQHSEIVATSDIEKQFRFAEWVTGNFWIYSSYSKTWMRTFDYGIHDEFTTAHLHDIYLQSLNKKS